MMKRMNILKAFLITLVAALMVILALKIFWPSDNLVCKESYWRYLVLSEEVKGLDRREINRLCTPEKGDSKRVVHIAIEHASVRVLKELLKRKDLNLSVLSAKGATILMYGIHYRDKEVLGLLINGGAEINATNDRGETALMYAVGWGEVGEVKLLIKKGADVNAKNKNGANVLMYAARFGDDEDIALLLGAGADTDGQDGEGKTAL